VSCFLDFYEIAEESWRMRYPKMDHLVEGHDA